jgi:anaerobic ribonucleoside-triphosphate reductase activating protein
METCPPLRIGHRAPRCQVLGPGTRAVVWFQGCGRGCEGCIAPELWARDGGELVSPSALAEWVLGLEGIDGLTVSGGEPMDQAEGLSAFLSVLRADRADLSIICYTGYALEELQRGSEAQVSVLGLVDVLIDGPYREDLDRGTPLRGSDNQRVVLLSARHAASEFQPAGGRHVEIVYEPDGFFLMGVPPRGFRSDLENSLRARGIDLARREEGRTR